MTETLKLHFLTKKGIQKVLIFIILISCISVFSVYAKPKNIKIILPGQKTNSISQYGITWFFEEEVEYGQFVNGDYWVVGPVSIIYISPRSENVSGRTINGSEINPDPRGKTQGYDSSMSYNTYDNNLNVSLDISSSNPLIINNTASLVSTISAESPGNTPQLRVAAVLTILSSTPPERSFRPPFVGINKSIEFSETNINYNLLENLDPPLNGNPSWNNADTWFNHVWLDYRGGVGGRMFHPTENMPNYGRDMASRIGEAALMLNLNYSNEIKKNLLIGFLQYGIDLWGVIETGSHGWPQDGGHGGGRKFPILFAGFLLDSGNMMNIGNMTEYYYNYATGPVFGEDQTTIYLSEEEAKRYINSDTGLYPTNNEHRNYSDAYYNETDWTYINANGKVGLPEYSKWYSSNYQGRWISRRIDASYRQCCHANGFTGFVLAVHIMDLKNLWNHDALFDYIDRYIEWATIEGSPIWQCHYSSFAKSMWDKYRNDYPPVWSYQEP